MKIGLLTSHRAQNKYKEEHHSIVSCLKKRGHEVIHSFDTTLHKLTTLSSQEREIIFLRFYNALEDCHIIFAECSEQSTQLGYGLSHLLSKGKQVIILALKEPKDEGSYNELYTHEKDLIVYEYTKENVAKIIDEAISFMLPKVEKRFTIIFPAHLLAKIEKASRKMKLPKAVFIRQLIQKELEELEIG